MMTKMEVISGIDDIDIMELHEMKKQGTLKFRCLRPHEMEHYRKSCEPMAFKMAASFAVKFPNMLDEFQSCALYGLARAAMDYDPERGVKFSTFSHHYIHKELLTCYDKVKKNGITGGIKEVLPMMSLNYEMDDGGEVSAMVHELSYRDHGTDRMEALDALEELRDVAIELGLWNEQDEGDNLDLLIMRECYDVSLTDIGKIYGTSKESVRQRVARMKGILNLAAKELGLVGV